MTFRHPRAVARGNTAKTAEGIADALAPAGDGDLADFDPAEPRLADSSRASGVAAGGQSGEPIPFLPGISEPGRPASSARLAYVEVPDFPLAAILRAHPELQGRPLAIVSGSTHAVSRGPVAQRGDRAEGPAQVICASVEARAGGIVAGLGAARARQRMPEIVLQSPSPDAERSAQAAMLEVGFAFSPKVEDAGPGALYLDLGGTSGLYPSEAVVATALDTTLERLHLPCRVGVAAGKTIARLAAREVGLGVKVVPFGTERSFLASLPLALLEAPSQITERLQGWGIRTLGELSALSPGAVARRLGAEGMRLLRLAAGEDDPPFVSAFPPPLYEEAVSFDDWTVSTLEPLLVALGQVIEPLLERVRSAGLALLAVTVTLKLDPRGSDVRQLEFAAPLAQLEAIMDLARHELYLRPPPAAVASIRAVGIPAVPRAVQGHLFAPPEPTPERLAVTLARLHALVGEDRVGAPAIPADKRPAAIASLPFRPHPVSSRPAPGTGSRGGPLPGPILVARALRPPRVIGVRTTGDRLTAVLLDGQLHPARAVAGPFKLRDGWWTSEPVDREDYDVELFDGRLIRIYHDFKLATWFQDGVYG